MKHWYVVGTVCVGAFLAALDASIVNIALPTLQNHFQVSMQMIEWISLIYLLTLAGLIVPFGRLADIFGRSSMYTIGFTVFVIGSIFCGTTSTYDVLLISRVFQAIGAAMLQANSVAIITANTPECDRGKAIGLQASAQGIGLSIGPVIGGTLISYFNWRWIFLMNVPIGMIGTILGILMLPKDKTLTRKEPFDFLGAIFLMPTLVSVIFILNMGIGLGWTSAIIVCCYIIFIISLFIFINVENKVEHPMVALETFRNRLFSLGNITGVLSFSVMYAVLLLGPFYLSKVDNLNPFQTGVCLIVVPVGMTLFTPLSGMIADRFGTRLPTNIGLSAMTIGCTLLSFGNIIPFLIGLFCVGIGIGIFTPPNNSSVMGCVPSHNLGVAGGILNLSRTLGMGFGISIGGLTYQLFSSHQGAADVVSSFQFSFVVLAVLAVVSLMISSIRSKSTGRELTKHSSV